MKINLNGLNEQEVLEAQEIVKNNMGLFIYYSTLIYNHDREDLLSELLLRFVKYFRKWKRQYKLSTFLSLLIKPAHAACCHFKRNDNKHVSLDCDIVEKRTKHYDADKVKIAIDKLPIKLRMIIIEYYYNGRMLEDIAENILTCTKQNVSQMLLNAREKLKTELREVYYAKGIDASEDCNEKDI